VKVLITGGSSGIGAALARLMASQGHEVGIVGRRADKLAEVLADCQAASPESASSRSWVADLGNLSCAERIAVDAWEHFGHIDVLVNNASELGPSPMPTLADFPLDELKTVFDVNVVAPLGLIQAVLPGMLARHVGLIVNVTSDAGVEAYPTWGGYGASKAALEHLSRVLAAEIESSGVRVYVVDPGDMNTAMHRAAEPGVDLSHLPGPDIVAPAFVQLLDETAPFGRFEAQRLVAATV